MNSSKILKLLLGASYLLLLTSFLYFFFSNFNVSEFLDYKFIQSYRENLIVYKNQNIFFIIVIFLVFCLFWVSMLGFGSPIALVGGFIFGKWLGTVIVVFGLTLGSLCLYLIGKFFFYNLINKKFAKKFKHLQNIFHKRQLIAMIVFRFVGLVPFFIANLLPIIFNIKLRNYYLGTFIGILPSIFILVSVGSGISNAIFYFDEVPRLSTLILLPEIYLPMIGFFGILLISIFLKNFFPKK